MVERELAGDIPIWVRSMYGAETRQPYVDLQVGNVHTQLPIPQARMVAAWINESAEAATQDAFLIEWMQSALDLDIRQAAAFLMEFREWRATRFSG